MSTPLDKDLASGMEKLMRASHQVRVIKRPSVLARTRLQLDAVQQARNATNESLLERVKAKVGLGMLTPSLDTQAALLQETIDALEADVIDGELIPLTENENWLVRAQFVQIQLYLRGQIHKAEGESEEIKAANKAADQAIESTGTLIWMDKWVSRSLNRRTPKGRELYWPMNGKGEVLVPDDVEKPVIAELFEAYHNAFTPTEAELKKLSAPTTRKTS